MKSFLGHLAAVLTIAAAALTPLLLIGLFTRGVAATGVRVDPVYAGPPARFTLERPGYRITVHEPFHKRWATNRAPSYIQVVWSPIAALPPEVNETLDLNGDGSPDAAVRFAVPRDPNAPLHFDVQALSGLTAAVRNGSREHFAQIIARLDNRILVRIPLAN
jgi:hypothetical protein